jgi:hypothetical protein
MIIPIFIEKRSNQENKGLTKIFGFVFILPLIILGILCFSSLIYLTYIVGIDTNEGIFLRVVVFTIFFAALRILYIALWG